MKKTAVIFPGIGYHTDKPLLYYSRKIAASQGYNVIEVPYGKFPRGVKGSKEKMEKSFFSALEQAEQILRDVDFSGNEDILFISKVLLSSAGGSLMEKPLHTGRSRCSAGSLEMRARSDTR